MKRPGPYQELTDAENTDVLGTINSSETWSGLAVEEVMSDWWSLELKLDHLLEFENPMRMVIAKLRRTSGSMDGDQRRDLKEAIIGAPNQAVGLSVPVASDQNGNKPANAPRKGL